MRIFPRTQASQGTNGQGPNLGARPCKNETRCWCIILLCFFYGIEYYYDGNTTKERSNAISKKVLGSCPWQLGATVSYSRSLHGTWRCRDICMLLICTTCLVLIVMPTGMSTRNRGSRIGDHCQQKIYLIVEKNTVCFWVQHDHPISRNLKSGSHLPLSSQCKTAESGEMYGCY